MKKLILVSMLIACAVASFAQTSPALTKKQYERKATNQRRTGWILFGVGITMIGSGALYFDSAPDGSAVPGITMITGTGLAVGSIPFFVSASKNRKRAAQATTGIKLDQPAYLPEKFAYKRSYPALSVKISF